MLWPGTSGMSGGPITQPPAPGSTANLAPTEAGRICGVCLSAISSGIRWHWEHLPILDWLVAQSSRITASSRARRSRVDPAREDRRDGERGRRTRDRTRWRTSRSGVTKAESRPTTSDQVCLRARALVMLGICWERSKRDGIPRKEKARRTGPLSGKASRDSRAHGA